MTEEELKAIENAKQILNETTFLADIGHKDLEILLNLIEKQQNKIKDVKTRLEYYLIGNMSFNKESQEEFKKLLKILEE